MSFYTISKFIFIIRFIELFWKVGLHIRKQDLSGIYHKLHAHIYIENLDIGKYAQVVRFLRLSIYKTKADSTKKYKTTKYINQQYSYM